MQVVLGFAGLEGDLFKTKKKQGPRHTKNISQQTVKNTRRQIIWFNQAFTVHQGALDELDSSFVEKGSYKKGEEYSLASI